MLRTSLVFLEAVASRQILLFLGCIELILEEESLAVRLSRRASYSFLLPWEEDGEIKRQALG